MPADFARTAAEITDEWLSDVLGATVTSFDVTFLEGGVLSEASRLHAITYDGDPGDAPPSVVKAFIEMPSAHIWSLNPSRC